MTAKHMVLAILQDLCHCPTSHEKLFKQTKYNGFHVVINKSPENHVSCHCPIFFFLKDLVARLISLLLQYFLNY